MQAKQDRKIVRFIQNVNEGSDRESISISRLYLDSFQWADVLTKLETITTIHVQFHYLSTRSVDIVTRGKSCNVHLNIGINFKKTPTFLYDPRIKSIETWNLHTIVPNTSIQKYIYHSRVLLNYDKLKLARRVVKHPCEFKLCLDRLYTSMEEMTFLIPYCLENDIRLEMKFPTDHNYAPVYKPGMTGNFIFKSEPLCITMVNSGQLQLFFAMLVYHLEMYPDVLNKILNYIIM